MTASDAQWRPHRCALPGAGEVDLWQFDLDAVPASAATLLEPGERRRADAFASAALRHHAIASRASLRVTLAAYLGIDAHEVRFAAENTGKPLLAHAHAHASALQFNLAHSAGRALIAVANRARVGVDIEGIRPLPDMDLIVTRYFGRHERACLEALDAGPARLRAFFGIWTRKEAFLKATGEGLSRADTFARHDVAPDPARRRWSLTDADSPAPSRWTLQMVAVSPHHAACVALEGDRLAVRMRARQEDTMVDGAIPVPEAGPPGLPRGEL
ncbi:MAG: 4'-phosphopantetheinyl transferase superfamily protein [Rhodocyclaceae bacterium]|nr:4'-phosphopantetheinyl transferase superfamily protein [Rhodocyclaceae bacterium]